MENTNSEIWKINNSSTFNKKIMLTFLIALIYED